MIMQNKPNSRKAKMNLNLYPAKDYENKLTHRTPAKQTQSNPLRRSPVLVLLSGLVSLNCLSDDDHRISFV